MIKAITFDLWDTIIHDESDEPKRAAQGLKSKKIARRELVWQALNAEQPIPRETVGIAYDVHEAAFNHVWHDQHVTWTVTERLDVLLAGLGRTLPVDVYQQVRATLEGMEIQIKPNAISGMHSALQALSQDYSLAVVSDAIYTPGKGLREWLQSEDLLQYFSSFAFSDEVGHCKPHRAMFAHVANELGIEISQMVHVGDRDHNDVKGPQALGMQAVLFAVTRDTDRQMTSANAICDDPNTLYDIIQNLARS